MGIGVTDTRWTSRLGYWLRSGCQNHRAPSDGGHAPREELKIGFQKKSLNIKLLLALVQASLLSAFCLTRSAVLEDTAKVEHLFALQQINRASTSKKDHVK